MSKVKKSQIKRFRQVVLGRSADSVTTVVPFFNTVPHSDSESPTKELSQISKIPFFCPKCNSPLKSEKDKEIYRVHQFCLKCYAEWETLKKTETDWIKFIEESNTQTAIWMIKQELLYLEEWKSRQSGLFSLSGESQSWDDNKIYIDSLITKYTAILEELERSLE